MADRKMTIGRFVIFLSAIFLLQFPSSFPLVVTFRHLLCRQLCSHFRTYRHHQIGYATHAMKIAIAGFMHESNTFSNTRTDRAAFEAASFKFGDSLVTEWKNAHHEMGGFIEGA